MQIPNKLKIGPHTYKVIFRDLDKDEARANSGYCRLVDNEIYINSNMARSQQESTMIHEAIEAINFIHELKLEHEQITALETAFYQLLVDNKL